MLSVVQLEGSGDELLGEEVRLSVGCEELVVMKVHYYWLFLLFFYQYQDSIFVKSQKDDEESFRINKTKQYR